MAENTEAQSGRVYLVGAGPGDPSLLTLRALRLLQTADVILPDDLVTDEILALVSPSAEIIPVGKRCGQPRITQAGIHALMLEHAGIQQRSVVRLKSGDPLVFGRAGEEIAALRAAGLEAVVVNGITSGLGAAATLGIGWTDRRVGSAGVLLVTGHTREESEGQDWDAIGRVAATGVTLVVYMGIAQIRSIVERLLQVLPAELPAAVVQHVGSERERSARATLGGLVDVVASHGFGSPAILLIGRVTQEARVVAGFQAEPRYITS